MAKAEPKSNVVTWKEQDFLSYFISFFISYKYLFDHLPLKLNGRLTASNIKKGSLDLTGARFGSTLALKVH